MKYSLEIDALNALVEAQHKTNELLEKLLGGNDNVVHQNIEGQVELGFGGEREIHGEVVQDGAVQSGKSVGKRGQGRGGKP